MCKWLFNILTIYEWLFHENRAPRCGVYWFAYSVAAKGAKFVKARLMVDNDPINAAVAVCM